MHALCAPLQHSPPLTLSLRLWGWQAAPAGKEVKAMHDLSTILKWSEEHISCEAEQLKREITAYRQCLVASDHPLKAVKRKQLQALLDRLAA